MNPTQTTTTTTTTSKQTHVLRQRGQSVWLDTLSRRLLDDGSLARLIEDDDVAGVTSNPTIFAAALAHGTDYDEQLRALAARGVTDPKDVFLALSADDIRRACRLLRPIYDETRGKDGYVSWEVDPTLAGDAAATVAEAERLFGMIDAPNLYVKIPATPAGVVAIEECVAAGRNINVTLIFSLARHREVMQAYQRGLERYRQGGGDVSRVRSVASFFVSRVDVEGDKRLLTAGHPELCGQLAIANAKLAYRSFREFFTSPAWQPLQQAGAHPQRCLWASTSTKNPNYRDVVYVEELVGKDTVNTMPAETLRALQDHGAVSVEHMTDPIELGVDDARAIFGDIRRAGVDVDDVTRVLEREGVQKFTKSFDELTAGIRAKLG